MSHQQKDNHVEEGLDNLIEQFKEKPKIRAVGKSYLLQIQDLENALSELVFNTTIDNAIGQHLDNLGSIVGEPRAGREDEVYRAAIKARIKLNTSEGTIEDVIELAIAVANAPVSIKIVEGFPASFLAMINEPIDPAVTNVDLMASFIKAGRPAGVRGILAFGVTGSFQYDGPAGSGFDLGKYGSAVDA